MNELDTAFARIPLLQGYQPADFNIHRLPGLTNHSFHIKNPEVDWVVRIPRAETNTYIDRKAEATNSRIAAQLGLAPDCLWHDDSGLSLTATLPHTLSPTDQDLKNPEILSLVLQKLEILHGSQRKFQGRVNLKALLQRYFLLIPASQQASIQDHYLNALERLTGIENKDRTLVPSHNDLVLQNLLIDTNRQLWFIDWEYSAMASPYWDLATLCNAADFDLEQCVNLLDSYHSQLNTSDIDLLMDYRHILQVLSHCWMMAFSHTFNPPG